MTMPQEERRLSPRAKIVVRVECKTTRKFVPGNLENIGEHGMLVAAPENFTLDEEVAIRFMLPAQSGGKVVEATARVQRSAEGQFIAFQFLKLPEKSRQAIAEFVAAQAPKSPA